MRKIIPLFFLSVLALSSLSCFKSEAKERTIVLYNWEVYTDLEVIDQFERETGIKVIVKEFSTEDMEIAEIQTNPCSFDVIVASQAAATLMKRLNLIEKYDSRKIPNASNVRREFDVSVYFPELKDYAYAPHVSMSGLAVNRKYVDDSVESLSICWDKKYSGMVSLLDDVDEVFGLVLAYTGLKKSSFNREETSRINSSVLKLKDNNVGFGDTVDNMDMLAKGEKWIVATYAGDFAYWTEYYGMKNCRFIFPKEGFSVDFENYLMTKDCRDRDAVHKLVNFLLRPDISARISNKFYCMSTVTGAEKFVSKKILSSGVVYPEPGILERSYMFNVNAKYKDFERVYSQLKGFRSAK